MIVERGRRPKRKQHVVPKKPKILNQKNGVVTAPLDSIRIEDEFNVRIDAQPDKELVASIAENGVLNPIHVRWKDDEEDVLYVVDGERRYRAAKIAMWTEVPVICRGHLNDKEALVVSLSTNENQLPLTREEKAEGFRRLRDIGMESTEISEVMGCSERLVAETLRLLDKATPPIRRGAMVNGKIPTRAASRAALLPPEVQERLAPRLEGKTTEESLALIRAEEKVLGIIPKGTRPRKHSTRKGARKEVALKASTVLDRLRRAERNLKGLLKEKPNSLILRGQLHLCGVLKGKETLSSLLEGGKKPKSNNGHRGRKTNGRQH